MTRDLQIVTLLESLDKVGDSKAVGYLPRHTVIDILDMTSTDVLSMYGSKGLLVVEFKESETCIKGGAFFVYDAAMIAKLIFKYECILAVNRWPLDPNKIIKKIAKKWYPERHPAMPFIRALYGDSGECAATGT
jgi:hypothetical protein